MDIERERSKRMRLGGKGMLLSGEGLEEEDLVLPGHSDEDEQAGDIRKSEMVEESHKVKKTKNSSDCF